MRFKLHAVFYEIYDTFVNNFCIILSEYEESDIRTFDIIFH